MSHAPVPVQRQFFEIAQAAEWVEVTQQALTLRDAYVKAGILADRWSADALHVALATVAGCDLIVSWNYRHIVHFEKVPQYNAINRLQGYRDIGIYTPQEVLSYEKEV